MDTRCPARGGGTSGGTSHSYAARSHASPCHHVLPPPRLPEHAAPHQPAPPRRVAARYRSSGGTGRLAVRNVTAHVPAKEISGAVAWLLSPGASYATGATMRIADRMYAPSAPPVGGSWVMPRAPAGPFGPAAPVGSVPFTRRGRGHPVVRAGAATLPAGAARSQVPRFGNDAGGTVRPARGVGPIRVPAGRGREAFVCQTSAPRAQPNSSLPGLRHPSAVARDGAGIEN